MRSVGFSILFVAFLAAFGATAAQAFDLNGEVRNKSGAPQGNVQVDFEGPRAFFAITDARGRFNIRGFEPGRYSVRVHRGRSSQTFFRIIDEGNRQVFVVDW